MCSVGCSLTSRHHGNDFTGCDDSHCVQCEKNRDGKPCILCAEGFTLTSGGICVGMYILIHYSDIIMGAMASQVTGVSIVCFTVCSSTDQRNIKAPRLWPLWGESTGPVTRKMFPFDDIMMPCCAIYIYIYIYIWGGGDHKNIFTYSLIFQHWDATGCWNMSLWKIYTHIVNIMFAGILG